MSWLFEASPDERSPKGIILWWERRRLAYNLIVGGIGFCSFILFMFFIIGSGTLKDGEDAAEPMGVILAPFAMNFFYTAGWIIELCVRLVFPRSRRIGPTLFKLGLSFSLFVVLFPSAVWGIAWILHVFHSARR